MNFKYTQGYTHAGKFHADDVFSAAFLEILNPDIKIHRVFVVPEIKDPEHTIVFDIGEGKFDHHQANSEKRENGVPYAAFGLIWREFGTMIFDEKTAKEFDEHFVEGIDMSDNTGAYHQLSRIIGNFNPLWNEDAKPNDNFGKAVEFAKIILEREFARRKAVLEAEDVVMNAFKKSDGTTVFLDSYAPWKTWLLKTSAKFVIFPSDRGGYNAVCVQISENENIPRIPFPREWSALNDEELEEASGIKGLIFCHKNCFLLHAKEKSAAIEAVNAAIENQKIIDEENSKASVE